MPDYIRGVKAGISSGLIFMFINPLISFIFNMNNHYYFSLFYILSSMLCFGIVYWIFGGLIFGIIFAKFKDKIPGTITFVKSITLSLIIWIILSMIFYNLIIPYLSNTNNYIISTIGSTLVMVIIYGLIFGLIWDYFKSTETKSKTEKIRCIKCGKNIPNDSIICPYCGKKT